MICRTEDLRNKDVINIKTGQCLGCVCDFEIDTCNACVNNLIIYGRRRFFGLFGRYDDIIINWCDIQVLGEDTILVCCNCDNQGCARSPFRWRKR